MKNERYFYNITPEPMKPAYKAIFQGLHDHAPEIRLDLNVPPEFIMDLYFKLMFDNPQFFYAPQWLDRVWGSPGNYYIRPQYIYSEYDSKAIKEDVKKVLHKLEATAHRIGSNELRLEKYIHDCVVKSVAYDYDALTARVCHNAHSIVGSFLENKAVCEGIAKAFKLICNYFNMKCIVVLGKTEENGDFDKAKDLHAWNMVKVEGQSYHVAPTWDCNRLDGKCLVSYEYFNLSDREISRNHLTIGPYPACTNTELNYYRRSGHIVRTLDELVELIDHCAKARSIHFKIVPSHDFPDKEVTVLAVNVVLTRLLPPHRLRDVKFTYNPISHLADIYFSKKEN